MGGGATQNISKSQILYKEGRLGIFLSPKAYVQGEVLEFFQVPESIVGVFVYLYVDSHSAVTG